jgi:hypothetical protein
MNGGDSNIDKYLKYNVDKIEHNPTIFENKSAILLVKDH